MGANGDADKSEKKTVVTEINSLFIVLCIAGSLVLILVILLVIRKMGKKKNKFYEKKDEIGDSDAVAIEIEMKSTPNNSLNETNINISNPLKKNGFDSMQQFVTKKKTLGKKGRKGRGRN